MKKLLIWTVLLLTAPLSTYAQNKIVTVSGRVIEAGTKEPVELAAEDARFVTFEIPGKLAPNELKLVVIDRLAR